MGEDMKKAAPKNYLLLSTIVVNNQLAILNMGLMFGS